MSATGQVETVPREGLATLAPLVARAPWLPFAYLPGITTEQATAWQMHLIDARLAADPDARLLVVGGARPAGMLLLHPLPWDSTVLGFSKGRVALCVADDPAARRALLSAAVDQARSQGWAAMDLQGHVNDLDLASAAGAAGFRLIVTHLGMVWDLAKPLPEIAPAPGTTLREAGPTDADAVGAAAARAVDPNSRFALDAALPPGAAAQVFAAWGANGPRGYADLCHVAEQGDAVVGYCNWKRHRAAEALLGLGVANLDLIGTVPEARGGGVLTALAAAGLRHWQGEGLRYAEVVTHVLNTGMQRACGATLGARTMTARHTFHWHAA